MLRSMAMSLVLVAALALVSSPAWASSTDNPGAAKSYYAIIRPQPGGCAGVEGPGKEAACGNTLLGVGLVSALGGGALLKRSGRD
ncbi:MAG: hypothetical protein JXR94_14390 [Candidatus Hydrogenedentes bacterium]|nr:hypothetical protein [Candidatus Hydrogenedentota bacterium]